MIPKIIHYCWFGGNPIPEEYKKYMSSWKEFFPDHEIKEWNESNFDINCCNYVKEAYEHQKWAFVSDYARFWILYHHGGLYFDTDVEVVRSFEPILQNGPFMGIENNHNADIAPGLGLGAVAGMEIYKEILIYYESIHFIEQGKNMKLVPIVAHMHNIFSKYELKATHNIQFIKGVTIYPSEYFNAKSFKTGEIKITPNTYAIHHFSMSWFTEKERKMVKLQHKMIEKHGEKWGYLLYRVIAMPHIIKRNIRQRGLKYTFKVALSKFRKK